MICLLQRRIYNFRLKNKKKENVENWKIGNVQWNLVSFLNNLFDYNTVLVFSSTSGRTLQLCRTQYSRFRELQFGSYRHEKKYIFRFYVKTSQDIFLYEVSFGYLRWISHTQITCEWSVSHKFTLMVWNDIYLWMFSNAQSSRTITIGPVLKFAMKQWCYQAWIPGSRFLFFWCNLPSG